MTAIPNAQPGGPQAPQLHVVETALGWCAIAWTEAGISGVQLPGASPQQTVARLGASGRAGSPDDERVRPVVRAIVGLFAGAGDPDGVLAGAVLDPAGVPSSTSGSIRSPGPSRPVRRSATARSPAGWACPERPARSAGRSATIRTRSWCPATGCWPLTVRCTVSPLLVASTTKRRMLQIEGALAPDEPTLF